MKYIRTKDGVYERMFPNDEHRISFDHKTIEPAYYTTKNEWVAKKDVIKQADTIEELIDKYVIENPENNCLDILESLGIINVQLFNESNLIVYGAVWTNKGLIYVAKMNDKGELELL